MHLLSLIPQMFDMSSDSPLASHRSPDSCSFTTLLYNQYKPGVMAVGCSNHSILLFSTANRGFADLFSSTVGRFAGSLSTICFTRSTAAGETALHPSEEKSISPRLQITPISGNYTVKSRMEWVSFPLYGG